MAQLSTESLQYIVGGDDGGPHNSWGTTPPTGS